MITKGPFNWQADAVALQKDVYSSIHCFLCSKQLPTKQRQQVAYPQQNPLEYRGSEGMPHITLMSVPF
jgi:hypothetical protein